MRRAMDQLLLRDTGGNLKWDIDRIWVALTQPFGRS
jgi:hypothetical protein